MSRKQENIYYDIDAIVAERKKQGYTQKSFADKSGVSLATIQALEQGARALKIDTMIAVCNALGVSVPVLKSEIKSRNGCHNCAWRNNEEWEMPCVKCRRKCKDYWRREQA